MEPTCIEEAVVIPAGDVQLEGVLAYPAAAQPTRALLCLGPHPHLGGTMDNNVIRHVAQRAAAGGAMTLRFNYRGIGQSGIALPPGSSAFDYYEDLERHQRYGDLLPDAAAAAAWLKQATPSGLRLRVLGYSLGAVIAYMLVEGSPATVVAISPPVLKVDLAAHVNRCAPGVVIGGDTDFAFDAGQCRAQLARLGGGVNIMHLPGCDHFFRKQEDVLYETLKPWLDSE